MPLNVPDHVRRNSAIEFDAGVVRHFYARVNTHLASLAGNRGHIGIVLIRRRITARLKCGNILANDKATANEILEAWCFAVFETRHEVMDAHIVLVYLHAVDLRLAEFFKRSCATVCISTEK